MKHLKNKGYDSLMISFCVNLQFVVIILIIHMYVQHTNYNSAIKSLVAMETMYTYRLIYYS